MSVIDVKLFRQISSREHTLEKSNMIIRTASGHKLRNLGFAYLKLKGKLLEHTQKVLVVEGLTSGAILGVDFLRQTRAILDTATGRIHFREKGAVTPEVNSMGQDRGGQQQFNSQVETEQENMAGVQYKQFPLTCTKTIQLAPLSCTRISLTVQGCIEVGQEGIIENTEVENVMIEAIVRTSKNAKVETAIFNFHHAPRTLRRGDIVGSFIPQECVETMDISELKGFQVAKGGKDREHLQMIRQTANISGDPKFRTACIEMLEKFSDCISKDAFDLGRSTIMPHNIRLKNQEPIHSKQFPIPWSHREHVEEFVDEMLQKGCLQASRSPYNAPIFCVKKPHGHGLRVVQDFRQLNLNSYEDKYVIREIQDCIDEIGRKGSKVFSTLDLTSGFWQQQLHPQSRPYTAFTVPGRGRFEWVTMPMGLHGAPSSFARLMDHVMRDLPGVITYIDDVLVHTPTPHEHLRVLHQCLERLRTYGLKLNLKKCLFAADKIPYLGYTITPQGVLPGEEKLKAVKNFPTPSTAKQIREFTGLANYFRQMIPNYSRIAGHLTKLITKENGWTGGPLPEAAQLAFQELKDKLCRAPVLTFPRTDRPFILTTDAATGDKENPGGLGAVLTQISDEGVEKVIAFASRSLRTHEKNYSAFLLEMAAASWAIDHFHVYLTGRRFTLRTDHKPLVASNTRQAKTLNRLQEQMNQYEFIIEHTDGHLNKVADALSRNALPVGEISAITLGLTSQNVLKVQGTDHTCQNIIQWLRWGRLPEDQQAARQVQNWGKQCKLISGALYKINEEGKPLLWIPPVWRPLLLEASHCQRFAGHGGVQKTLSRLQSRYYWPNCAKDVAHFVAHCKPCQGASDPQGSSKYHAPFRPASVPTEPNFRIHTDLMGPLKTEKGGTKYILVITDAFSKYAVVSAIPDKNAQTVAEEIFDKWIRRFSCPRRIVSDNGKEFCNKLAEKLWKLLGVQRSTTSVCHPQGNSQAERYNRVIGKFMRAVLDGDTLNWESWLAPLEIAYNTHVHKATMTTPFFLTYGVDPRLPYFDMDTAKHPFSEDWALALHERLKQAWARAHWKLVQAGEKQALRAQQTEKPVELKLAQKVLVKRSQQQPGQNNKFLPRWMSGYVIVARAGPVSFVLFNKNTGRRVMVHADRIKGELPRSFEDISKLPIKDQRMFHLAEDSDDETISFTFRTTPEPLQRHQANQGDEGSPARSLPTGGQCHSPTASTGSSPGQVGRGGLPSASGSSTWSLPDQRKARSSDEEEEPNPTPLPDPEEGSFWNQASSWTHWFRGAEPAPTRPNTPDSVDQAIPPSGRLTRSRSYGVHLEDGSSINQGPKRRPRKTTKESQQQCGERHRGSLREDPRDGQEGDHQARDTDSQEGRASQNHSREKHLPTKAPGMFGGPKNDDAPDPGAGLGPQRLGHGNVGGGSPRPASFWKQPPKKRNYQGEGNRSDGRFQ